MIHLKAFRILLISLTLTSVLWAQKQQLKPVVTTPKVTDSVNVVTLKDSYPVAPFQDTLFFIHNKIGGFSPEKRAKAIADRIRQIYSDPLFEADSLKIVPADITLDIVYKEAFIIMSITTVDAKTVGKDSQSLAQQNIGIISKAIVKEKENNAPVKWMKRIALELLFIGCIALLLFGINVVFRKFKYFLIRNDEKYFKGILIKNFHILSPANQLYFTLRIIGIIRTIVFIFIIYLSLPLLFSVFPSTVGYTTTLIHWIMKPAKFALVSFIDFLPNLFSIIVIVVLFHYALKIVKYFVDEIQKENINIDGFYSDWAKPTFNIIRVLLYAFMLVILFPYLPGSDSPIFKGVTVFVGILFSIGSSNAIANMVAGLVITYMRPFKIGDFIKIGEVSGSVIEKTALVTRIRTPKMEDITIPNATVLSSSSINFSANTRTNTNGLVIHSTVTIGYDVPWREVHKALIEAANRTDLIEKEPLPFVLQTSLDDFYVSYEINAYTKEATKQPLIYSNLHQNIQDCFNEAGIEIMSPHYKALRDGNHTTIPESYLSRDYQPSVFQISNDDKNKK
nr:mechanosensitive ion channel family protein [uncultured Flavobacterium sp.]